VYPWKTIYARRREANLSRAESTKNFCLIPVYLGVHYLIWRRGVWVCVCGAHSPSLSPSPFCAWCVKPGTVWVSECVCVVGVRESAPVLSEWPGCGSVCAGIPRQTQQNAVECANQPPAPRPHTHTGPAQTAFLLFTRCRCHTRASCCRRNAHAIEACDANCEMKNRTRPPSTLQNQLPRPFFASAARDQLTGCWFFQEHKWTRFQAAAH